jgi:hypothetical protein
MMIRNKLLTAVVATATCCLAYSGSVSESGAPIITYEASGKFATSPISGSDTLKLAGEPFIVRIAVSAATEPVRLSPNSATYNKLKLTGSVYSGLLGSTPVAIASSESTIIQSINPGQYDVFTMESPITVIGISLTIKAVIALPIGTITKPILHPFTKAVDLAPGNATATYSDSTAATVLAIQSGTLNGTIPSDAPTADAAVGSSGAENTGAAPGACEVLRDADAWARANPRPTWRSDK